MIALTQQQLADVSWQRQRRFYRELRAELVGFIGRHLPDMPTDEINPKIDAAFRICRDCGFDTERQIAHLSHILVTFPDAFHLYPEYRWVHDLLVSDAPADQRLARLHKLLTE